jgi:hypothetical protein
VRKTGSTFGSDALESCRLNDRPFVPPDYLSLCEAVRVAADCWYKSEMDEIAFSPEDARFYKDHCSFTAFLDRRDKGVSLTDEAAERQHNIKSKIRTRDEILNRAWERLSGHLYLSAFPVFVIDEEGTRYEISATFWGSRRGRRSFHEIMMYPAHLRVPQGAGSIVDGTPVVRREQLTGFLAGKPSEGPSARSTRTDLIGGSPSASASERPKAGGRPPKYNWEAFLLEAFRIVWEDNPAPETQAELIRRTLDWYQKNIRGPTPDPDQCKPKIRRLWTHFGLRAEG